MRTSAVSERYDRNALDYVRYWAPVLARAALRLLDEIDPYVRGAASRADGPGSRARIMDIGAGTGVLAIEAVARWPDVEVTAVDASGGMLAVARRDAARLPGEAVARLEFVTAFADRLPAPDRSIDVCVSSFVFQLVPDRAAAFREAFRVLRPGGRLGFVTWIDEEAPFEAADAFDDVVVELGLEEPDYEREEDVSGDFPSAEAAEEELAAAGFTDIVARRDSLVHEWTLASYLDYKEQYAEATLFASLEPQDRDRLRAAARRRLGSLGATAFRWRTPVVYAFGSRPRP